MAKKRSRILRWSKIIVLISGTIFLFLIILAFTTAPYWAYYHLGNSNSHIEKSPKVIVLLSGGGIPSENGLLRAYYTSRLALQYPGSHILIIMPGDTVNPQSAPQLMKKELILRGAPVGEITIQTQGHNTRGQALFMAEHATAKTLSDPITLVTAPEHMKRAVLVFRKCGFTQVSGLPTFENALDEDLSFNDNDLKGNTLVPPIGNNLQVRYQFWNHLKYEIIVTREYFALLYYKVRGWI